MRKNLRMILLALAAFLTIGCTGGAAGSGGKMETITAQQAKQIMDSGAPCILLDVRQPEEYAQGHIRGARLIPDNELKERAPRELTDKGALILVYCRSGRRSLASAKLLAGMGYANIKDMGGIIDWPYEVER